MTTVAESIAASSERLARHLGGTASAARVAVLSDNRPEMIVARDACTAAGAVMVPINPKLAVPEIGYVLAHSRAERLLLSAELEGPGRQAVAAVDPSPPIEMLEPIAASAPWRIDGTDAPGISPATIGATIIYTSGTTGVPKGCVRTAEREAARAAELASTYGISRDDVHLIACPLAHSAPGIFLRAARAVGAATVLMPRFRPEAFLEAVARERATFFFLVPTQYQRLLALPEEVLARADLSSVRAAIVAGAPMHAAVRHRIIDWLGDRLWEFYGSSETGTVSILRPADQVEHGDSVGRLAPGVDVELRASDVLGEEAGDVGEIFVRSPTLMNGYLNPERNAVEPPPPDGFLSVGDLGRLSEDGYLILVDRAHDTIITGGVNVYPAEVERAVLEHPAVAAAVVFGVEDEDWGQRVIAMTALRGAAELSTGELRAFLRPRLAAFKLPREVLSVAERDIPIGSSGKPQRRQARQLYLDERRARRP